MKMGVPDPENLLVEIKNTFIVKQQHHALSRTGAKRKRQPLEIVGYLPRKLPSLYPVIKLVGSETLPEDQMTSPKRVKLPDQQPYPAFATTKPEPSSINDLIRQHPRTRLYVKPSQWTPQHLELLQCHFGKAHKYHSDLKSSIFDAYQSLSRKDTVLSQDEREEIEFAWERFKEATEYFWTETSKNLSLVPWNLTAAFGAGSLR